LDKILSYTVLRQMVPNNTELSSESMTSHVTAKKGKKRTVSGFHLSQEVDLCVLETVRPALEDFAPRMEPKMMEDLALTWGYTDFQYLLHKHCY